MFATFQQPPGWGCRAEMAPAPHHPLVVVPQPEVAIHTHQYYPVGATYEEPIPLAAEDSETIKSVDSEADGTLWRAYAQDAHHYDKIRVEFWNRRLDVQLLFAGIFSALIIPLLAETYEDLSKPGPPGCAVRVNMMFAVSLVVSVATAVYCLHCKQWLEAYDVDLLRRALASSELQDLINACRVRQYRYRAFQRYHMPRILGLGALFLYVALITFTIGLVDFFWHIYFPIGIAIASIAGVFVLLHTITSILPCTSPDSPFKSPLSYLLANGWRGVKLGKLGIAGLVEKWEAEDVGLLEVVLDKDIRGWAGEGNERKQRNLPI